MRDPKRKKRILKLIASIWESHPDLRLMQLVGNCFEIGAVYHLEDTDLETILNARYLGKHI